MSLRVKQFIALNCYPMLKTGLPPIKFMLEVHSACKCVFADENMSPAFLGRFLSRPF